MESQKTTLPDYLFEVSWEVCNKVGGIHTVIATKALTALKQLGDNYITIGPDLSREDANTEFEEDPSLLRNWRQVAYNEGLRIRVGRWRIKGSPIVVLVDFSSFISHKDEILAHLWETYKVDSLSGQWDYVEPVMFGYVAARVIDSYVKSNCKSTDKTVAHFHEWMTASGSLYLHDKAPYIATVFTTHATVMGRCIAGNGLPLYSGLSKFNVNDLAHQFNVVAKYSIEKAAADNTDCFTTVSQITERECKYMLGKEPNVVTPNGFEDDIIWKGAEYKAKQADARNILKTVAETSMGFKYEADPVILGISGRYEYKNKGIDEFIDSLALLNENPELKREVLAYILVPSWNHGPRRDLQMNLEDGGATQLDPYAISNLTHYLGDSDNDPVINHLRAKNLLNNKQGKVKVMFVPCYLNGEDGIFNKSYYELLVGMDATVFPSYYEPWGYTPLESIAFSVPTITTSLAGFGIWVNEYSPEEHKAVKVIPRDDFNNGDVTKAISDAVIEYSNFSAKEVEALRKSAKDLSKIALWSNLFRYYEKAYCVALSNAGMRYERAYMDGGATHEQVNFVKQQLVDSRPTWTRLMIERVLPERLHKLEELTKNLWWSWNSQARMLFESIDPILWRESERNPIELLDKLDMTHFRKLEADTKFLAEMDAVYAAFKAYMDEKPDSSVPSIAYFSMEYGLHSSLKIYSGGLGILAGDYLKEASDKNIPLKAVGLLYRYGYFTQRLSADGGQEAGYEAQNFMKLPISPVRDASGHWKTIEMAFPGRMVTARLWRCDVGRIELYLLDTDHDLNLDEDRAITYHLYGGDWENRLKQEMLLGIGGIRCLNTLNKKSDVYHCNEGHAAFIGMERINNYIKKNGLSFSEALEVVRSSSLFTTHTPVPAGHDAFPESMIRQYMSHYPDKLKITWEQFINLGKTNPNDSSQKFSMSVLASNMSQEVNGVSWLHGEVSKEILRDMWPGYFPDELHIGYVTNGVHFPTWAAGIMKDTMYAQMFGSTSNLDYKKENWDKIYDVSDQELWTKRLFLKERLIKLIRRRVTNPSQFRYDSPKQMIQIQESFKPDVLTIGFARRFATYKRAHLLFSNLDRLDRIVNKPDQPVQFVFAGKAHPADKAGQDLIKRIVEVAKMPQFIGKIIFLQNYDMELARRMVQGVDVWMNTPTRPLEASGTSGEKAVMNGVLHFSVLDGWWVEGYKENAGWKLPMERTFEDQHYQDEMDAEMIYNIIEGEITAKYYKRDENNVPTEWCESMKKCIAEVASNFTTRRMMEDYENRFYHKLHERNVQMKAKGFLMAREIAAWKRKVSSSWDKVHMLEVRQEELAKGTIMMGSAYHLTVKIDIDGLNPEDIGVELVISEQITDGKVKLVGAKEFEFTSREGSIAEYAMDSLPQKTGTFDLAIRMFAKNPLLPHRMDFALVKWA